LGEEKIISVIAARTKNIGIGTAANRKWIMYLHVYRVIEMKKKMLEYLVRLAYAKVALVPSGPATTEDNADEIEIGVFL